MLLNFVIIKINFLKINFQTKKLQDNMKIKIHLNQVFKF